MTYSVAIIGAGIGCEHAAAYAALPNRFRISMICDRDEPRARSLANQYPDAKASTDLSLALGDPNIDIIDICLPSHLHVPVALDALAAGKHVVCEKPVASSLGDADRLAEAETSSAGRLFPVFQYRYGLGTAQLRALMDHRLTGPLHIATLETHWDRNASYYSVPWRGTWEGEGGGCLVSHAIHLHDLLLWTAGSAASVTAETATRINDIETEDCVALAIRMENGALITSSVTLGAARDASRIKMVFEGVTVESGLTPYAPAAEAWSFTARYPRTQSEIDAVVQSVTPPPAGFVGYFSAVADALEHGVEGAVTLAEARGTLELITAAYKSSRTGARVTLPIASDDALYESWRP